MTKNILGLFIIFICVILKTSTVSAQESAAKSGDLQIVEAKLGASVQDRMISGEDSSFALNSRVCLWLKVTGGSSDQIIVIWKTGDLTHSTALSIGGSPWRTWATKTVGKAGDWAVSVTDTSGKVLKEMMFKVK